MIKQAPSAARIAAMVVFGLSCFGILLYMWISFGGSVPLKAERYRFSADFREATLLAENADVRISGVPIGKIVDSDERPGVTRLTMEVESKYAPIPRDTRAILRRKTALGEAYVELSPGNRRKGSLPDEGHLPRSQVAPTVELDELIADFDERTRGKMQKFVTGLSVALEGRGEDLNRGVGHLDPLAASATDVLGSLDRQEIALSTLVRDTGIVFESLGRRQGELSGIVRAGERLLATTAARNRELQETTRILPVTLRELRPTFAEISAFSREARPVLRALRPAGRALGGALTDARALAPELRRLFGDLDRVIRVSRTALPALTRIVRSSHPVVRVLAQTLREALPVVDYLGLYKQELVTQISTTSAATQPVELTAGGKPRHYLRTIPIFAPEGLTIATERFGTNRYNPYLAPRALDKLSTGLESFDCRHTGNRAPPGTPAPPCKVQAPFDFRGRRTAFPQLRRDP